MAADLYISADIEADGPIPGAYSMLAFGLAVAGRFDGRSFEARDPSATTLYRELRPISENIDPDALRVASVDRRRLEGSQKDPHMADLCCQRGRRPKSPDRLARWVAGGLVDADTAAQLRAERLALAGGRPVRAITLRAAALVVTGLVGVGVGMALDSPEPAPAGTGGPGTVVFTTTVGIVQ